LRKYKGNDTNLVGFSLENDRMGQKLFAETRLIQVKVVGLRKRGNAVNLFLISSAVYSTCFFIYFMCWVYEGHMVQLMYSHEIISTDTGKAFSVSAPSQITSGKKE